MAPEVVDQSGATTASDIWSLGALVVELLTGKPPYHFLDPMPALFRIVNDDSPPLPEGASAVVRDFLVQCFQKDGNLRIGARKLLRHPWMLVAKKQQEAQSLDRERIEMSRRGTSPHAGSGQRRPISLYDDTVQQVQQWNEALKGESSLNYLLYSVQADIREFSRSDNCTSTISSTFSRFSRRRELSSQSPSTVCSSGFCSRSITSTPHIKTYSDHPN